MCWVPPERNFFWPGLKIPRAGGLASSAGNLFQGFTSLRDKKPFLVCNSLHSWNSDPEATKEDGFSDTIWAFVWTGLEIWDLWKGWIFQSESKVNWFILVLFLLYVPQTLYFLHEVHTFRLGIWKAPHGVIPMLLPLFILSKLLVTHNL